MYCTKCKKLKELKKSKISYICHKILLFFSVRNKCEGNKHNRFKNMHQIRYYFLEEIGQNELMSKKHKMVFATLSCIEFFLILDSGITGCILISALLLYLVFLNLKREIAVGIKMYKSIIKEKKKKHDGIFRSAKSKLNSIKVLHSKTLIDCNISHDEFVLIKEYDNMKEKMKHLKT